ncbi:MAG: hypothetical protein RL318_3126 [Fibrobacterota bacterium]|jgi:uncharacterized protein (TIGR01777 family)
MTEPAPSFPEASVIAITGASGLVGRSLHRQLTAHGHRVITLTRRPAQGDDERQWSLAGFDLSGVDAVIHLAGESIASGLWTTARKRAILESRVDGTRAISRACGRDGVRRLLCASAVGFYGDRGEEALDESGSRGSGFLSDVCTAWEDAASGPGPLEVAHLRFGQILSWEGGALSVQARLYRLGMGARLGSGRQWMPWISLVDACNAIEHALNRNLEGALNVVSPVPARQEELHHILCTQLHRPRFPVAPEFLLRLLPGGFGKELLLTSARVTPKRLTDTGFAWSHPRIADALK